MIRQISDLRWVKVLAERPKVIPLSRPRGVRREGIKFEEALACGALREAQRGMWLEFSDANGHGFAQCDFFFSGDVPVIAEAKLTWRREAYVQLRGLYLPLLRAIFPHVGAFVVCANLTRDTPRDEVVHVLPDALSRGVGRGGGRGADVIPVLHLPQAATVPSRVPLRPTERARMPKWWGRGGAGRPGRTGRIVLGAQ